MRTASVGAIAIAALLLVGCGTRAVAAGHSPAPSPTPRRNFPGASGQLVAVQGQTLTLSATGAGDTTVSISSSTTIETSSSGSVSDIQPGSCVVARGQRDANGTLTAVSLQVTPAPAGGCAVPAARQSGTRPSPRPGATPRPRPSASPQLSTVYGQVGSVAGTTLTVDTTGGSAAQVVVPSSTAVRLLAPGSTSSLVIDECVTAVGTRTSTGTVQARQVTVSPPPASGTCAAGFGGPGGRSGRRSPSGG